MTKKVRMLHAQHSAVILASIKYYYSSIVFTIPLLLSMDT